MMKRVFAGTLGLIVAMAVLAAPARAQVELGWDAMLTVTSVSDCDLCDDVTMVTVPGGQFRAGFMLSPAVQLEPSLSFLLVSEGETFTFIDFGVDLLYHFNEDATKSRFYVAFGPGLALASGGGDSATQFSLGAKAGFKLPASGGLSFRVAGTYERGFENNDDGIPGTNSFGVLFGASVMVGE